MAGVGEGDTFSNKEEIEELEGGAGSWRLFEIRNCLNDDGNLSGIEFTLK